MRRWMSLGFVLALSGLGLWGCDNTVTPTDAGMTTGDGGGGGTDSGPMTAPVIMAFDGTNEIAADLSCMGTRTAPMAGAATDFPARTVARGASDAPAPNIAVQLFQSNVVPNDSDACTGDCVEFMSDASGEGTVNLLADGWFAYRVLGDDMAATVVAYNEDTSLSSYMTGASGAIEFSRIGASLFNAALGAASVEAQPGLGIFTGTAYDCAGNTLVNARLRVFTPRGSEVTSGTPRERTGPRLVYWAPGGLFPMADLPGTSTEGRFAGGNMPFEDTLRIELWGRTTADGADTMVACEQIGGAGDRVTLINLMPARADGPSDCSM